MIAGCGGFGRACPPERNARRRMLGVLGVLVLLAPAVQAQTREPRVFLTVGGGMQSARSGLTDRVEWEAHLETAVATVDYGSDASRWFGGGAGIRLWRQLGAGVAFSSASRDDVASVQAQIPHPFFFERPRDIEGQSPSLSRSETAVHLQALYIVPSAGRLRIILSAGPSRIEVSQGTVTAIRYTEAFPFDTAAFDRADTRELSASAVGFNAGADVAFMLTRAAGLAGLVRFTQATVDVSRPDGAQLSLEAGGVQAGVGLRIAF